MAKNKTFKRQAEATRLLEKIGATRRKSRKAGITVTGDLKESLRGRQSADVANALKFTAKTALDEAEKLYNDLIDAANNVDDKTSQKLMQEYLSKYSEHIKSLNKSIVKLVYRVIACLLIFFLPSLIFLVFKTVGYEKNDYVNCLMEKNQ